ncbi:type IV secretory system conjugative DNA transfer family protein [Komagataeibacter sp. FNDCR2]|uniref:type IV secretory system conjugative DNA transfer family protein n=1 Tax=Komagataeibacter sp. FNDCR2 TaxID=2878682 RepID=UPI001E40F5B5|nr:type IV secretory system conjugative DNA transfer family protein [Komagataeibacter sp. FNDCR2]MCE2576653.1 type IV secretion system DotC family protein [Komagataeibacter sp. FNDCR2]
MYKPLRALPLLVGLTLPPGTAGAADTTGKGPVALPVPSVPSPQDGTANPVNTPLTGAFIAPVITDVNRPPSMEALMAIRPGYSPRQESGNGRDDTVRQAAWAYGAQGGLAGRSYAINRMLERNTTTLDREFDFRPLVLPVGNGSLLLRPPVVTNAQMAVALDPSGQTAQFAEQIYEITRQAQVVTAAPQWRTWLTRRYDLPAPPSDALRPRTAHEVSVWREGVARGFAAGERQAVEIFLDDLARLEREIVGMARYRMLLKAGKVEAPQVALLNHPTQGGRDLMRVNVQDIRISSQPGLDANRAHWRISGEGR